ncbi:MAG: penicillin-binding protein 2, partial [Selenomonas sp.]|nr:penicillin-binding protein 2 [Selenomonas sp.]
MLENDEYGVRLDVLGYLAVLVIAVLIGRAGYLQIYDGENYARLAEGNRIRIIPTMAPRGTFFDRNGELLVQNRPGFAVSLMPVMTKIYPVVIQRLSTLLKVPVEDIDKKIAAHTGFDPIRIKADVTPDIVTIIEEQKDNYPGVVIEVQPIRDYMNKEEAAHTYGYVSEINDM